MRQEFLIQYKLEKGCIECGYREHHAGLQFDHLPQYGKQVEVATLAGQWCTEEELLAEIAKCEVVCATHHAVRTWERQQNGSTT